MIQNIQPISVTPYQAKLQAIHAPSPSKACPTLEYKPRRAAKSNDDPPRNKFHMRALVLQNSYMRWTGPGAPREVQKVRETAHYLRTWIRAQNAMYDRLCRRDPVASWRACFKAYALAAPTAQVTTPRGIANAAMGFAQHFVNCELDGVRKTNESRSRLKARMRERTVQAGAPYEQGRRLHRLSWGVLDLPPKGPSKLRQTWYPENTEQTENEVDLITW